MSILRRCVRSVTARGVRSRAACVLLGAIALGLAAPAVSQTEIPKTRRPGSEAGATIEKTRSVANEAPSSVAGQGKKVTAPAAASTPSGAQQPSGPATVTGLHVAATTTTTTITLSANRAVTAAVFTLATPHRVVIDLPDVDFTVPQSVARQTAGLVKAVRFGLMAPGRARVVIETKGPVAVAQSVSPVAAGATAARLEIALSATTEQQFVANLLPLPQPTASDAERTDSTPEKPTGKPVVMIDPGHGGIDGGASGPGAEQEKDVVLAVALKVRDRLAASGRYDVRMTRSDDRFLSLDQRVKVSRQANASLFVSIHADAVPDAQLAGKVHGASVYTLSERASNLAAQQVADKENASDVNAGIELVSGGNEQISSILSDLIARETHNFSLKFRSLLTSRLTSQKLVSRDPSRAAAFRVLRQPETPSVLVELGFMTNQEEVRQMQSEVWQLRVTRAITTAIDAFFADARPAPR